MVNISENDLNNALIRLYKKNKDQRQNHQQKTFSKEEQEQKRKKAFEEAETEFLAHKVWEPCNVKEIYPLTLNQKQEQLLIDDFMNSLCADNPAEHTLAMEGKPFTALVQMENGLVYMAVISQIMPIYWPGGVEAEIKRQMAKMSDGLITFKDQNVNNHPTVLSDLRQYHAQLYPMHLDKDIRQFDYLGLWWRPAADITDSTKKPSLLWCPSGAFRYLCNDGIDHLFIESLPPHIHKLLGEIQKVYDQARAEKKIGKPIYARFDPNKPPRGRGWTIPIDPFEKREYFNIPALKIINPNRKNPLQIIDQKLMPKRIVIAKSCLPSKRINTHE